ncbi:MULTISPECIES: helix-turn-helix domain-containing protein [Methylococcus]|uniref:Putative Fis-like DNA-binding protein n=1 Tax=Methylococcus capsulatus TaxID=414 RepID=A0ABZ2F5Z7_METCP|nr:MULTISPECIES: helix-turn-helix domain-containing protein [Methylococcus]
MLESFESPPKDPSPAPVVLSEQVRAALVNYLSQLDGISVTDIYTLVMSEVERPLIRTVLEHCCHNQTRAAQLLGLSRSTLRKKMLQHGIE